jgi:hypothetical protein
MIFFRFIKKLDDDWHHRTFPFLTCLLFKKKNGNEHFVKWLAWRRAQEQKKKKERRCKQKE